MGVGGKFWDLLKPYQRNEGVDSFRDKRVAVDLSFWIVQQETAIKNQARNPHLRLTFFRTINLFAKFGAYPVFVVDGTPSPLKSRARISRFYGSSFDCSSLAVVEDGVSVERNRVFQKFVQDCVELIELFGMPVLKAKREAEALCAQLNRDGHVDACITADSDAFLYGAKCVIKSIRPNTKEPFECYYMSDIEAGLGLQREHLIAISLLVGNDHDLNGVQGIGLDTALHFVKKFDANDVLNSLRDIGTEGTLKHRDILKFTEGTLKHRDILKFTEDSAACTTEESPKTNSSHCSFCGHPGNKRDHSNYFCELCSDGDIKGCLKKPVGFKCNCSHCEKNRQEKEQKRLANWWTKVCNRISVEQNFPNEEIIEMYLSGDHGYFSVKDGPSVSWQSPKTEMIVDFLVFHQNWEPSYIRQRILPMLSTIYLREMAITPIKALLHGQYEFHSIHRVKIRFGYPCYVVKWKKAACSVSSAVYKTSDGECDLHQEEFTDGSEPFDLLDESNNPQIFVNDGCWVLLTDENSELVRSAFPDQVDRFLLDKEARESKRRKTSYLQSEVLESPKSKGVQLSITKFYRSVKVQHQDKSEHLTKNLNNQVAGALIEHRKVSSDKLSKSTRRRLLFN